MKAGIKIGPRNWQQVLSQVNPECLEVWFRLDWYERFLPLFNELNRRKIPFDLHFWATVDGKFLPNLMSLKKDVAEKTFLQIVETINIASKHNAYYVNFHPESYRQPILDLDRNIFLLEEDGPIDRKKSFEQLNNYLTKIRNIVDKKNIIPFVETVPKFVPADFKDFKQGRKTPQKTYGLETEKFIELAKIKQPICLDLGHTMGQCITDDKNRLFDYLYDAAKKLLPAVGLMHVTTNKPPFNGTDSHNGVLQEDFEQGVVPDRQQLIKLLKLFKGRDVWLIPEPHEKMVENYLELKKIVEEIEKEKD